MELKEIGPNVYACLQEDTGLGKSNSGLINRAGGLVVDTFWDLPHTREMIRQYSRVWASPAERVVNTHRNGDHCWGNQLFPGAEIIAHRACADMFHMENPAAMQALRDAGGSDQSPMMQSFAAALSEFDFTGIELTPPTTTIDDRLDLELDGLSVSLIWVGAAHTAGDIIVHLPEQKVVFTGDVLFRLCTPIGWEGTFEGWIGALQQIEALEPDVVVPGHGPLCGIEGPREMRGYLEYVRGEAKQLFEKEVSLLDACKKVDLGPYANWTEPERLAFNMHRAYRELRGGAFDEPINTTELFGTMFALREFWSGK